MSALQLKYQCVCLISLPWLAIALNYRNNACTSFAAYHIWFASNKCYYNPDVLSDVPSIVQRHNYKIETYSVTTDDGYILNVFRILANQSADANTTQNPPVFIQHGIAVNSGSWVDTANKSLAFNLVDLGYDVWLGNVRGSVYANKNKNNLTVNNPKYWDFNLDTMAKNDISAQLNLVANVTGRAGYIIYIGHSMGTTLGFMYASEYYEEAQKLIQGIVALAPVVYLTDVTLLQIFRPIGIPLFDLLSAAHIKGLFYHDKLYHEFITNTCKILPEVCYGLVYAFAGRTIQFPPEDLLLFFSYWPSGLSVYQLKQYLQISYSGRFQKFDYGRNRNTEIYGTALPPTYNLTNINNMKVFLYYGLQDNLYRKPNLDRLFDEIGSTDKFQSKVPSDNDYYSFNHIDFLTSKFIKTFLYEELFDVLDNQFEKIPNAGR